MSAAEGIETALDSLALESGGAGGGVKGIVQVLAPDGLGGIAVGEAMRRLSETHPGVRLEVVVGRPEVSRNE
ncbi:hypothetical protein [Kocuria marina]|uniref:hypothetical protein n=1 Tax=Kocuria marina TaxID=223184 RepID=UPI001643C53D